MQIVECNGRVSGKLFNNLGVPEGTTLGPTFFNLYINDISNYIYDGNNIVLFADDTTLILSDNNIDNLIYKTNLQLKNYYQWSLDNYLAVNEDKTKFMLFMNNKNKNNLIQPLNRIVTNNRAIQRVNEYKLLGLKLDDHLTMHKHHELIINHIKKYQGFFYKLRDKITTKNKYMLYNTWIA